MEIHSLVDIVQYTTFKMGPRAKYFAVVKTLEDLIEGYAFGNLQKLPIIILGGGSNVIFAETNELDALVLKIEIEGFTVEKETSEGVQVKVGAGELWDDTVKRVVEMGLWGVEALSWIPGTVGATPIQNVGAYGREISDVLVELEALNIVTGKVETFANQECKFAYRDSVFKNELKNKYVILSVTLMLSRNPAGVPNYPGVKKYFEDKQITNEPSLAEIRKAIIEIRNVKLPDPKLIASVGSFFKNPIVSKEQHEHIKNLFENVIAFDLGNGRYKIGAGWILETLGLKGKQFGNLLFYPNNALVLVNAGQATFDEITKLVIEVNEKVRSRFGITLEVEPTILQLL